MNCKFCFTENPDDAVFCKACGRRLDGMAVCGSCAKQIPADSTFCPYCGVPQGKPQSDFAPTAAAVSAGIEQAEVKPRKIDFGKIFRYAVPAAALIVALLSFIFVFCIGFKATAYTVIDGARTSESKSISLFYYFGDAYKEIAELFENLELRQEAYSDYFASAAYIPRILGTVVAAVTILSVSVLAIFALVFGVLNLMGKTQKTGGGLAVAAFVAYLAGALALFALNNLYIKATSDYFKNIAVCNFDGATLAGISLCSVFAIVYYGLNVARRGRELLKARAIVQCVLSLVGFGILIAIVALLAKPTLSADTDGLSGDVFQFGLMYILGLLVAACQGWDECDAVLNRSEATAYLVIAGVMVVVTIVFALFALAGFAKKTGENNAKKHLAVCVLLSVFALLFMTFTIVGCKEFVKALVYLDGESTHETGFVYAVPIAVFVLSVVALAVSAVQCFLARKKPTVETAAEVNVLS